MNFIKTQLGLEDTVVGQHTITQIRNGKQLDGTALNIPYNCGLLKNYYKDAPNVDILIFTGFYEEGDLGAGIYEKLDTDQEEDIGVILQTDNGKYRRLGSEVSVIPEWFGAVGDGKFNNVYIFETMLKAEYTICLTTGKNYYLNLFTHTQLPVQFINIYGNGATITINREPPFRLALNSNDPYNIHISDVVFANNHLLEFVSNPQNVTFDIAKNVFNTAFDYGEYVTTNKEQTIFNWKVDKLFAVSNYSLAKNLVTKKQVDEAAKLPATVASKHDTNIPGLKLVNTLEFNRIADFTPTDDDILSVDEVKKYLEDNTQQYLPNMDYKLVSVPPGETYTQYKAIVASGLNTTTRKREDIFVYTDKLANITAGYRVVDGELQMLNIAVAGKNLTCDNGIDKPFVISNVTLTVDYIETQEPASVYGGIWKMEYEATFCKHWRKY